MTYSELAKRIAHQTGLTEEAVKDVLFALPDALIYFEEGKSCRTPLGMFRMTRRKGRRVNLPGTDEMATIEPILTVKLRPGPRLRKP